MTNTTELSPRDWAASLPPEARDALQLERLLYDVNRQLEMPGSIDKQNPLDGFVVVLAYDLGNIATLFQEMRLDGQDIEWMREARRFWSRREAAGLPRRPDHPRR
jgi:hypothetical protein